MRTKQVLSWILTLAMCLSMFSIPAMADGETPSASAGPEFTKALLKTETDAQGNVGATVTFEATGFTGSQYTVSVYQKQTDGGNDTYVYAKNQRISTVSGKLSGSLIIDTQYVEAMLTDLSSWYIGVVSGGKFIATAPLTVDTSLEIIAVPNNYDDVAVPDENRAFKLGTLIQTDGDPVMITVPLVSEEKPLMATQIGDGYDLWAAIGIPQNNYTYKLAAFDSDAKARAAIEGEGADEWVSVVEKPERTIGGVEYDIFNPNWAPDLLKDGDHFYLLVMSGTKAQYLIKFDYTNLKLATVTFDTNGADDDEGGDETYMLHGDTELVRAGTLVKKAPVLESTDNAVFKGWYLSTDATEKIVVDEKGELVEAEGDETQDATYTAGDIYYPKWVKQYDVKIKVVEAKDETTPISGADVTLGDVKLDAVEGKPGVYATSAKVEEGKYALTVSKTLYGTQTVADFEVGDKNYSIADDAVIKTVTLTPVKYTVEASLAEDDGGIASVYGASGPLGDYTFSQPVENNTYNVTGTANYIQMDEFFGEKKDDDESGTFTSGYYLALHFPQPKDTEGNTFTNGYKVKIGEAELPWAQAFDETRNNEKVLEIVKHIYNKEGVDKAYTVSFYLTEESKTPDLTYTVNWDSVTFGGLKISNVTVDWDAKNNKYVATAENLPNGISLKLEDNKVSIVDKQGESEVKFANTNDLTIVKGKNVSDEIKDISLDERVSDTAVTIQFTAKTETIDAPSIVYNGDGTLSLKTDIAGAEIYYTTNGDEVDTAATPSQEAPTDEGKPHGLMIYNGENIKITQGKVSTIKAVVKLGNLTSEQLVFNKPVFGTDTEYDSDTGKLPVWISNYDDYAEHLNGKFYFGFQYQKEYKVETSTLRGGMDLTFAKNEMKIPAGVNLVQIWIFDAPVDVDDFMDVNAHIVDTYTWPTKTSVEQG